MPGRGHRQLPACDGITVPIEPHVGVRVMGSGIPVVVSRVADVDICSSEGPLPA